MGFAERLNQSVVTDNLASSDLKLMPVDFVASLSGATSLGSDLMRSSDYDLQALRRSLLLLTRDAINTLHIGRGIAQTLSLVALCELLHWQCRTCRGAGQVIAGQLKIVCPDCGGVGTHRWTDNERARTAKIPHERWVKMDKKYNVVLDIARDRHTRTIGQSKKRMGY